MVEQNYKSGFVALIGRPNAGKSTLLNRILGQKVVITSDKPQTTRKGISGIYTTDTMQVVFIDTPGVHKPQHKLGEYMMTETNYALKDADVIFYLVDTTISFGPGEEYIIGRLQDSQKPVFLLLNKIDLLPKEKILALIAFYQNKMQFAEIVPISAAKGDQVVELLQLLAKYLPNGPQYYPEDMVTEVQEREITAELIREKALLLTRDEIPHALAVEVLEMKERANGTVYIGANIYVERESQKGILIGKKGEMLKKIGSLARPEIEEMLDAKVFLELWVKVRADWRNNQYSLNDFGFHQGR